MKIVVLGAGFAGLASALHLIEKYSTVSVTVIDGKGIGSGASGVAAGLLHPYVGLRSRLNIRGREAYTESKKLLDSASEALGAPVYRPTGLLRPAITEEQMHFFREAAEAYPDIRWLETAQCQELAPGLADVPGIFIETALTIDPQLYLKGLWQMCEAKGAVFIKQQITTLEELNDYDLIVVAMGADTLTLSELAHLPLTPIKGQILEFAWPKELPKPSTAVNSQVYLLPDPHKDLCIVGSTFERHFAGEGPDMAVAMAHMHPKLCEMYPAFADENPLRCMAGVRASAPQHMPFVQKINHRCWVYSGLGSKGLLYHALFAQMLCN